MSFRKEKEFILSLFCGLGQKDGIFAVELLSQNHTYAPQKCKASQQRS